MLAEVAIACRMFRSRCTICRSRNRSFPQRSRAQSVPDIEAFPRLMLTPRGVSPKRWTTWLNRLDCRRFFWFRDCWRAFILIEKHKTRGNRCSLHLGRYHLGWTVANSASSCARTHARGTALPPIDILTSLFLSGL